jgi:hypothetical protein
MVFFRHALFAGYQWPFPAAAEKVANVFLL